jgi:hypothetical protein
MKAQSEMVPPQKRKLRVKRTALSVLHAHHQQMAELGAILSHLRRTVSDKRCA